MKYFKKKIIKLIEKYNIKIDDIEIPPNPKMGDYAVPCFIIAKKLKKSPNEISKDIVKFINKKKCEKDFFKIESYGPYVNFFVNKNMLIKKVLEQIKDIKINKKDKNKTKKEILIEFPSPNTNKPLHLGHLRNIFLSQAVSNILSFAGNKVIKINLNNDRGIHICKSMLAYKKFGKNKTPEKEGIKSDHFVGDYYVLFNKKIKENPILEKEAQEMLIKWEKGDKEVNELWKKMNNWAFEGFKKTYNRLNLKFDKQYYESKIYKKGKKIILDALNKKLLEKDEKGNIVANLEKFGLGKKVVLRSDGTSVYATQDIALAKEKEINFPNMDLSIYVVATEQNFYFKQLSKIFEMLKLKPIYHLSYGMVLLPDGKMKSREGSSVDADNILDEMISIAKIEIEKRYDNLSEKEILTRAKKIGIGALRFYILKTDKDRDIIYNPKESIDFNGETAPYLQYVYARINSIKRKFKRKITIDENLMKREIKEEVEIDLIKKIKEFTEVVVETSKKYNPAILAKYLIELGQLFNKYYNSIQIITKDKEKTTARIMLIDVVQTIIKKGLNLLEIDVLEEM